VAVRRTLAIIGLFGLGLSGPSCSDKSTPTAPSSNPAAPVTSVGLKIFGPTASIGVGQSAYLRAAELRSNGEVLPVFAGVLWSSSEPSIAAVAADGSLVARVPGSTTVTAKYLSYVTTIVIRVAANWADLDFRVAILNASSSIKPAGDVMRIFNLANDFLFERTGARMRVIEMREFSPDPPSTIATAYMNSVPAEQPDGVIVWTEDATAVSAGGFSQTLTRPAPYTNRFPATVGANRLFVSAIHYEHKFAKCGYDTTGGVRISEKSANGECRGVSGLTCVSNGRFWECPGVRDELYAQPDMFTATTIVHEFLHPVGFAGNDDHYGTATCTARVGLTGAEVADRARAQWHANQCPDLFLRFRPAGVPNVFGR